MSISKSDLVKYRISRAKDTYEDALILIQNAKWNSAINRLYYAAYYAVMALLIYSDHKPQTHNGAKSTFSEHFIKTGLFSLEDGKLYSQLFNWKQKGDYDDFFDFDDSKVLPYIEPVRKFIFEIENRISL